MKNQNHLNKGSQLQAYLDGVLEPSLEKEIQTHLEVCPQCQMELARLEALRSRLETLPEISLSRDLSGLVISQLEEEKKLSSAITWTLVIETLAAGSVIAALIPAFQAAGRLPQLIEIRLTLGTAVSVFLTQLASSWIVWWSSLKLQISQLLIFADPLKKLGLGTLSPWILVGAAGVLVILLNAILLGQQSLPENNQKRIQA